MRMVECDQVNIYALTVLTLAVQCPIIMTSNHSSPGGLLSGLTARIISFAPPSTSEVQLNLLVISFTATPQWR